MQIAATRWTEWTTLDDREWDAVLEDQNGSSFPVEKVAAFWRFMVLVISPPIFVLLRIDDKEGITSIVCAERKCGVAAAALTVRDGPN
jgi:hypothetical protein